MIQNWKYFVFYVLQHQAQIWFANPNFIMQFPSFISFFES